MSEDDDEILSDHRWRRTKLVPPMVDTVGDQLAPIRWNRERTPDFLWIGLLHNEFGGRRTVEIVTGIAETSQELFDDNHYVLTSEYDNLSNSEFEELQLNLSDDIIEDLGIGLKPLLANYPSFPLSKLADDIPKSDEEQIGYLSMVVDELANRYSPLATYVQAIYVGSLMATGNLTIPPESPLSDINQVFNYPDTERSQELAAVIRAATKSMGAANTDSKFADWSIRFWQRGYEITECIFPQEIEGGAEEDQEEYSQEEFFEELAQIGLEYEEDLRHALLDLWRDAEFDAEFTGKHEVLDGLLFRQVNLVTSLATSPQMWSVDVGSIILRCMAETYITLEWFNQNGEREDYQRFIEYGLGQEKLLIEHGQDYLSDYEGERNAEHVEQGFEDLEERLESQRYKYLIPVDVGHWANKNTRTLAKEADCEDTYNLRFNQYSGSVHGQWNTIDKHNLVKCHNPLHQYHKVPEFRPLPKVPLTLIEAGNLMNQSLDSWIDERAVDASDFEVIDLAGSVRDFVGIS